MFKRLMVGLFVAGLVVAWVAPEAEAVVTRWWRSIVSEHTDDAVSVSDRIYGVRLDASNNYVASCTMPGLVFCDPVLYDINQCPVATETAELGETDFVDLNVPIVEGTALTEAELNRELGQGICNQRFGFLDPETNQMPATIFRSFWPQDLNDDLNVPDFVAHTTYNYLDGRTSEIKQIGYKPIVADADGRLLARLDNYSGSFPCCGVNTLAVNITDKVGGKVSSDDDKITDCTDSCTATYDSSVEPFTACPEVLLTAEPNPGYTLTGWDVDCGDNSESCIVDGCLDTGQGDCKVKPGAEVTASFGLKDSVIRLIINQGAVDGSKVWIKEPQKADYTYPVSDYCQDDCIIDTDLAPFNEVNSIVLKRAQGDWSAWSGIETCSGPDDNSNTTCIINLPLENGPVTVYATWN